MKTALTQTLGIRHPVVQAPIGSAACPELAAAVSNAGGLGFLALSWTDAEECRRQIRRTRLLTEHAFGVNLVLDFDQDERVNILLEEGVPVVSFFWGNSEKYLPDLRAAGIKICQTVGTAEEGTFYESLGVDVLFAQGWEAGGHVWGEVTSLVLLQELARAVKIPVVGCGGFVDGRGLVAALSLGAAGICMGTRFLMSREARIEPEYARLVARAVASDTVYAADLFHLGWENAPHRILRNSTTETWRKGGKPAPGMRPGEGTRIGTDRHGKPILLYSDNNPILGTTGDLERMALYAGQSAGLLREVSGAAEIVESVMRVAGEVIRELAEKSPGHTGSPVA